MNTIQISHLDVVFGDRPASAFPLLKLNHSRQQIKEKTDQMIGVQDIDLSISTGEVFVIMGLSGSGKSTLLRAINGLIPISRGRIEIQLKKDEHEYRFDLGHADEAALRRLRRHHVAMVFQNFALLPWKTVAQNIAFGLEIAHVPKAVIEEKVRSALNMVSLSGWANEYPKNLSGGMKQRVGLARALATDADILLMDEPFSALDPLNRAHLQKELQKLQKELKKTLLFVTHDLDEALKLGDRIAIMQDGKISQVGYAEEIVAHPKTPYVRDFVAHIDQMRLLRAKNIMTPIRELKVDNLDHSVMLEDTGRYRCILDDNGRPRTALSKNGKGKIVPWTIFQSGSFDEKDIILGCEYMMAKDVIDAIGRSRRPMVIQDKGGRMVGVVTSESVLTALSTR